MIASATSAPDPQYAFTFVPGQVVFGVGQIASINRILTEVSARRVLFICTPGGRERYLNIQNDIGSRLASVFAEAEPHCPIHTIDRAIDCFVSERIDTVVAVGGGSTIGLGKILKAEHGAKFIAIPTTYSGSEMTPIYGRKSDGQKRIRSDHNAIPDQVIYDPAITRDLPAHQTAATGMNSLAHAVEALYPETPNPIAFLLAKEAIALHAKALPACIAQPFDLEARSNALYAAMLGGVLVSMVGVALHHGLGHVLGGLFDLRHGDYNSVVLPHAVAFNAPGAPQAADAICEILQCADPGEGLFDFALQINAPTSLKVLGMPESGITKAASAICRKAPRNPRPFNEKQMAHLISAAYRGDRPSVLDYQ